MNKDKKPKKKTLILIGLFVSIIIIILLLVKGCNKQTFEITFKDYDGTTLQVKEVEKGELPVFDGTPLRNPDDTYEYTFLSWDKDISKAIKDETYTAVYTSTLLKVEEPEEAKAEPIEESKEEVKTLSKDITNMSFWVVFYDQYGNELQREALKYGTVPEYKGWLPEGFEKWDKSLKTISGNTYYHAICHEVSYSSSSTFEPTPAPTITNYTVTFNTNGKGTAPAAQTVVSGSKATKPADPTDPEGKYVVKAWYKEPTCENEWNFDSDTVTTNTTLYAKWINALSDKILKAKTIYTDGEPACLLDSTNSVISINGIDCYVLQVDGNKAELITKGIYDVRFSSSMTGVEFEYKYSISELKTWMDNFYTNKLASKDGTDYTVLDTTINYYYDKNPTSTDFTTFTSDTITQKVFALDATEAKVNVSKFSWSGNDTFIDSSVNAYGFWVAAGYGYLSKSSAYRVPYDGNGVGSNNINYSKYGARPAFWISFS